MMIINFNEENTRFRKLYGKHNSSLLRNIYRIVTTKKISFKTYFITFRIHFFVLFWICFSNSFTTNDNLATS